MSPLLAHETVARASWRHPNDLKVEVLGARTKSQLERFLPRDAEVRDSEVEVSFANRPWFVPRALGDSIRLLGVPETAALHPLAPGAESFYDYAIVESVSMLLPGRTVRAVAIRVRPRLLGPSIVAGDLWVDAETADVVRLMVTFLGEYLWDTPDADAVVLGDMGEVGAQGTAFHEEVGAYARTAGVERLYALGDLAAVAARAVGAGGRHYARIDELLADVENELGPQTTLLVKGSRFMQMERVVGSFEVSTAGA